MKEKTNWNPKIISWKELRPKAEHGQKWLIQDLVPLNCITMISGKAGISKTFLIYEFVRAVLSRKYAFGHKRFVAQPTGVMVLDGENGESEVARRLKKLGIHKRANLYFLTHAEEFDLTSPENVKILIKSMRSRKCGLLVIDPLVVFQRGDENTSKDMSKIRKGLKMLKENEITTIIAHHHRKEYMGSFDPLQALRGSSDIGAAIDVLWGVYNAKGDNENKRLIRNGKMRIGPKPRSFYIEFIEKDENNSHSPLWFRFLDEAEEEKLTKEQQDEETRDQLRSVIGPIWTTREDILINTASDRRVGMKRMWDLLDGMCTGQDAEIKFRVNKAQKSRIEYRSA